jgi:hypothetical protein
LIYINEPTSVWHRMPPGAIVSFLAGTARTVRGMTLTGAATPIWYVTFEIRKRGILPKQRSPRETRTFVTEDEAKIFARSKLEEGLTVFAGTINPHFPKRLVPSSEIYAWLADEHGDNGPPPGDQE